MSSIAAAATVLSVVALLASMFLLGAAGPAAARAARPASTRSCASYPTPGSLAPAGTRVPTELTRRYAVLRGSQRPQDRLPLWRIRATLGAADIIASGTRFLGRAAFGARVYLVPAEHLLAYRLAPLRCFPRAGRSLEHELQAKLRREYRHLAVCLVVLGGNNSDSPTCSADVGTPDALLYTSGTPGFGLVPNDVKAVTVGYQTAPPRTLAVHRNAFVVVRPHQAATPCGVQWLTRAGTVLRTPTGCSYLTTEKPEIEGYRTYVAGLLSTVTSQVNTLASAISAGDVAQAESDWLTAHLTWLDIGQDDGAYGCFGELGGEIDGLAAGHPDGTSDPGFTGFHRIEYDLWTEHSLSAAASDTATLQRLLAKLTATPLATYLPTTSNGIAAWVLRPHEVLEDALRDSLTADDDYGSGTDLASITADVSAVRTLLGDVGPTLDPLAPRLRPRAERQLTTLVNAIDATRTDGAWVPIDQLTTRQRQQIDADTGAVLETLAPVPDLLTSTGSNGPTI